MINPYKNVDLKKMDGNFSSLIANSYAAACGGETHLSQAERATFRVGLLVGGEAWETAGIEIKESLAKGWLVKDDLRRILEHDLMLMGARVAGNLERLGKDHGVALSTMREAVDSWAEAASHGDMATARIEFALGLGITWGAGCWDS